jgi:hypothetical protein
VRLALFCITKTATNCQCLGINDNLFKIANRKRPSKIQKRHLYLINRKKIGGIYFSIEINEDVLSVLSEAL